jgi:HSP20 family protein
MNALAQQSPVISLRNELDRVFDRFWETSLLGDPVMPVIGEWRPILDVFEDKEILTVCVEIPGIDPKNAHVTYKDQILTIRGEKKQEKEEETRHFYHAERMYGTFTRNIRLPFPVDEKKVMATFRNGLLTIHLPKVQGAAVGTNIPIKID